MKNDEEIFQSLIAGGIVGASLGALLSGGSRGQVTILGAIAGAAILATYKANEKALQTNLPMYAEENGSLYQIQADGKKNFI